MEHINPQTLHAIVDSLLIMAAKKEELQAEINRLEQQGCIDGFLRQTPTTLRLHYRRSDRQDEMISSREIQSEEETSIRIQLENYIHANYLRDHIKEINYTIERTHKGFEEIKAYVEKRCQSFSQLAISELVKSGQAS